MHNNKRTGDNMYDNKKYIIFSDVQSIKLLLTFLKARANNEDSSKLEVACINRDLLDENKHILTQRALDILIFLTVDIYNKSINFLTDFEVYKSINIKDVIEKVEQALVKNGDKKPTETNTTNSGMEYDYTTNSEEVIYLIDDIQKLANDIRKEYNISKCFSLKVFKHILKLLLENNKLDYRELQKIKKNWLEVLGHIGQI